MDRPRLYVRPLACAAAFLMACERPPAVAGAPAPVGWAAGDVGTSRSAGSDAPAARVVVAPSAPAVPGAADAAGEAATLRELARAADHAGDSALAVDARRQADALAPAASALPAAAPIRASGPAGGRAPARKPAARAAGGRSAAARGARARARSGAAARRARPAAPRPRPDRRERAIDRLFGRAEGWLSGGRHVRRPSP